MELRENFALGSKSVLMKLRPNPATAVLAWAVLFAFLLPLQGQTRGLLYSFNNQSGDGDSPLAGLTMDPNGNLYGTTMFGGSYGNGTVFMVTPDGAETILYSFTGNGVDGSTPIGGLVMDKAGNIYGTTASGGANGGGTAFKLTPDGAETVLHSFCSQPNCTDGYYPTAGLMMDSKRNLYGTTIYGGADGAGAAFKLTSVGDETVVFSFCLNMNCASGASPYAGLIKDRAGNLYGTTAYGGGNTAGTVFELTPGGLETVLHSFGSASGDGTTPYADLTTDSKGNLYGTTITGGANGEGTVFEVTPGGAEAVLHSFGSASGDGTAPYVGLIMDKEGNLYGTTRFGGATGYGTVFELSPPAKIGGAWIETVFTSFMGGDGSYPYGRLIMDKEKNLYGTTSGGGPDGLGTVFKISASSTTTKLSSSPNPSESGKRVTLTAIVTGSSVTTPTGKITFKSGTTALGTARLKATGTATATATLKTTKLPTGSDSLTAVYGGDTWNLTNTSAPLIQVVK